MKISNIISKELATKDTPKPSQNWLNLSESDRIEEIKKHLKSKQEYSYFDVIKASNNGFVTLKTELALEASKRGILLLDLEKFLKENIDYSITIWLEPIGDKSKLRNLRGIEIKT